MTIEGALGSAQYVVNFVTVKRTMKRLTDELDHRMLLPTGNPEIDVREEGGEVTVHCQERRYVFPRSDVVLCRSPTPRPSCSRRTSPGA